MNQKEYELIAGALARTRMVANMDKNEVRRAAKLQALQLMQIDLVANMKHHYTSFNEEKFKLSIITK